ncbi:MAG: choice-of-anchor Q domain-containing protein [Thermomicrobiales bacterium]
MRRSVMRHSLFVVGMLLVALLIPCAGVTTVQAAVGTVTVNDTVDEIHSPGCATTGTGTCSLRDGMKFAATAGGSTTIILGVNATYTLTIVDDPTVGSPTGLPAIVTGENLTIIGNGATVTRSAANGTPAFRLLHVAPCGTLALTNLTLSNGLIANDIATVPVRAFGGAIFNEGTLTIANATVSNNTAAGLNTKTSGTGSGGAGGGALFNTGALTLATVMLTGNKATVTSTQTGASANMQAYGGAIYNFGTASLIAHTVVSGNAATIDDTQHDTVAAGGGGIMTTTDPLTVLDSSVSGNTVSVVAHNAGNNSGGAVGGGIATFFNPGTVTVTNSTISNNSVTLDTPGTVSAQAGPGGIFTALQTFTLTNSTVSNNSATNMNSSGAVYGGVWTIGPTTITDSTISGNTATGGGGLYVQNGGGGLVLDDVSGSTNTVTNTTISNNTSPHASGIYWGSLSAPLKLIHTTIAGNTSGIAGQTSGTATISLQNTILANTGANCPSGHIISADYNLTNDATCTTLTAAHDHNGTNPLLGPLQLNAPGTTETQALLPGSPAIDQIPNAGGCNGAGVTTDQRGVARPQPANGLCDIGAYEVSLSATPAGTTPVITPVLTGPACGGLVLTSIAVTPANPNNVVGATQQFKATATYANSSTADITGSVIWSSDMPTVATIVTGGASAGLATGVSAGTAKISALLSGVIGSTILTVTGGSPTITLAPSTLPDGAKGTAYQTTMITASGGTAPYTFSVAANTLPPGLMLIPSTGVLAGTPTATGSFPFTVTAMDKNGFTGMQAYTVTITATPLVSIVVTPSAVTLKVGQAQPFKAMGAYADNSTVDLTNQVTWSSDNASVATVDTTGKATAQAPGPGETQGTAHIKAVQGAISGQATVSVMPPTPVGISVPPVPAGRPSGGTTSGSTPAPAPASR